MSYWNKASQSDSWNNANFLRIIKYQNQGVRFEKKFNQSEKIPSKKFLYKNKIIFSILKEMLFQIDRVFSKISFIFNKVYIEPFYISKIDMINFYLKCNQFPSFQFKTFLSTHLN